MQKHIKFDRLTKDYAAYLNGQLVGYFRTHSEAQSELDRLAFEALKRAA